MKIDMNKVRFGLYTCWFLLAGIVFITLYFEAKMILSSELTPNKLVIFEFPIVVSAFVLGKIQQKYDDIIDDLKRNLEFRESVSNFEKDDDIDG